MISRPNPRMHPGPSTRSLVQPLLLVLLTPVLVAVLLPGCSKSENEVVLYVSLDEAYSRDFMDAFKKKTGITVKFLTDSEATKTTGLVTKILGEKARPRCDVFWNNEIVQTIYLKRSGCLAPFSSESAKDIPEAFKDPEGFWVGFAARARVIIYNKNRVKAPLPTGLEDLLDPRWAGTVSLARPLNGTTATHAAVLWAHRGPEATKKFFKGLDANRVKRCAGNAHVMREVSEGNLAWGFTDTDDFHVALLDGKPVGLLFPDTGGEGTLLIPNTVCMIKNGPNPENARKLIDYILSREVETTLAQGRSAQIPVRDGVPRPTGLEGLDAMKPMKVNWPKVGSVFEACQMWLKDYVTGK